MNSNFNMRLKLRFCKNILDCNVWQISCRTISFSPACLTPKVVEVGRVEALREHKAYDTGQLFIHRVFGYRGIVLFPWMARVYDRSATKGTGSGETNSQESDPLEALEKEGMKRDDDGTSHIYYQAFIDSRDCTYLKLTGRAQTEAVTFLGNKHQGRTMYAVPGLDYVAHEDIVPYSSNEHRPIYHDLFHKFLHKIRLPNGQMKFEGREYLRLWMNHNHTWLEMSDVYKETTEGVRVTAIPFYMGNRDSENSHTNNGFWWRYCIRLENLQEMTVQLEERHWRIFSLSGSLETIRGKGVVGLEPVLTAENPAFQYSSHVSLNSPSGHMWGTFKMRREDGYVFECRIPPFALDSKTKENIE